MRKRHINHFIAPLLLWSLSFYLLPCAGGQVRSARDLSEAIEKIDALTASEYARTNLGSISVGVVSGPKLIWAKSYGYADVDKKVPATVDTVYRLGGTTVKFTALMLLQLVEDGKVKLSDPVEKFLPEVNKLQGRFTDAPPVTLAQLATHMSGIAPEPDDAQVYTRGPVSDWEKILIEALPHTKYVARPGSRFVYSNIGYAILGAALSRAAKQPYVLYVKKRIFKPLGMTHSGFEPDAAMLAHLAAGYVLSDGKLDPTIPLRDHQGRGYKVPNGAVYSTVGDMARYISFELGEGPSGVLSKGMLADNYKQIIKLTASDAPRDMTGYGIGFQVMQYGDLSYLGHGGAVPGYHARADFDRASETGFIVLRNVEGGDLHVYTLKLAGQALSQLAAAAQHKSERQTSNKRRSDSNAHE
jgi:CubicO group peptidase (beta-lactamase class C family)